jgi:hypothetical protein
METRVKSLPDTAWIKLREVPQALALIDAGEQLLKWRVVGDYD